MVRRSLKDSSIVTAPSAPLREAALRSGLVTKERLREWSLGVDTTLFCPGPPKNGESRLFTFVTAGSLIAVKGQDLLINALACLRRNSDARLVIAGTGPRASELRSLARRLGLEGYVDFRGEVPHDALPDLFRSADCFVLSSWHEAQCMAALEAMACGLPCISLPVGALADAPDQISRNQTGIRVAEREPEQFSRAMSDMVHFSYEHRVQLGVNARQHVEINYDLKRQTERLLDILRG